MSMSMTMIVPVRPMPALQREGITVKGPALTRKWEDQGLTPTLGKA